MAQFSLPTHFFENAFANLFISPSRRKLQRYFDELTRESLWVDLERYFHPSKPAIRTLESQGLFEVFDACCINNTDQQAWNEDSFQNYLGIAHPQIAISKEAVHLLWKIFHHYAYHPFTPKSPEGTIDADGFRRAIMLLSARCTDLLGTLEHDYHWTMVNGHIRNRNIERIFRIIGQPYSSTCLEDVMDALASAQPCFTYCELPSPQQVEVAARRLIGQDSTQSEFRVARAELSTLVALMLRLKVTEANSRIFSYHGSFDEADPVYEEMAEIVVDSMIGQGADSMGSDQIHSAVEPLQNFYGRFQLLWAILFQPLHRGEIHKFSESKNIVPNDARGVLSLLLLPSDNSRLSWYSTGPYAWETSIQLPAKLSGPKVTHITECLFEQSESTRIMLVTVNKTSSSPKTVWGVLFSGSLSFCGKSNDWAYWKTNSAHLFQIRPQLKWANGFDSSHPLTISINKLSTETSTETESNTEPSVREVGGIHLRLDWSEKSIVLGRNSNEASQEQSIPSDEVFLNGEMDYFGEVGWETSTKFDDIHVLSVPGARIRDNGLVKPYPDQSKSFEESISRDELKSRIQGFGSS